LTLEQLLKDIQTKIKFGQLIKQNKDKVEKVYGYGFFPRVYLIGEYHFETNHMNFTSEAIKTLHPNALFWEAIDNEIKPTIQDYTLSEKLRKLNIQEFTYALLDLVPTIDPLTTFLEFTTKKYYQDEEGRQDLLLYRQQELSKIRRYQKNSKLFLDEVPYKICNPAFELLIYSVRKLLTNELGETKSRLEQRLTNTTNIKKKHKIQRYINSIQNPKEDSDLAKLLDEEKEIISKKQYRIADLYFWLKKDHKYNQENLLELEEDPRRLKEIRDLQRICAIINIKILPFDDYEAKNKYLKLLKSKILNDSKDNELNQKRETTMFELLNNWLNDNPKGIALTQGGRYHIKTKDFYILKQLEKNEIPYRVVLLKKSNETETDFRIKQYDKYIRKELSYP